MISWQRLALLAVVLIVVLGFHPVRSDDSEDGEAALPFEAETDDSEKTFEDMMAEVNKFRDDTTDKEPVSHHKADEIDTPDADKAHFYETFKGNWESRWGHSDSEDYAGRFVVGNGPKLVEGVLGQEGLLAPQPAKKYAIAAPFANGALVSTDTGDFVAQYELQFHEKVQCAGSYIKLLLAPGAEDGSPAGNGEAFVPTSIGGDTPYVVMFGPDICGDAKVHFIVKKRNPTSGEWVEHHLVDPPPPFHDPNSHLYTLVVRQDDTYAIYMDQEVKKEGSMLAKGAFDPPFQPPEQIADPAAKRPADWVTKRTIADPEDVKPADWNDDAPTTVVDESVLVPADWLVDEPLMVPDPDAVKPSDWDAEDDGAWEAPLVPNPVCKEVSGCGPWKAPMIPNPEYRGVWEARQIPNPAYVGEWQPNQIPNPEYFVAAGEHAPHRLAPIGALGIEIWTMQPNIQFDNFFVGAAPQDAAEWGDATWGAKQRLITELNVDDDEFGGWAYAVENPVITGLLALFAFLVVVLMCIMCPSGSSDDEDAYEVQDAQQKQQKAKAEPAVASAETTDDAGSSAGRPRRRRVA